MNDLAVLGPFIFVIATIVFTYKAFASESLRKPIFAASAVGSGVFSIVLSIFQMGNHIIRVLG